MTEREMSVIGASAMLGLAIKQLFDEKAVMRAYKSTIIKNHPDKNPSVNATRTTQKINEARDILLEFLRASQPAQSQPRPPSPPKGPEQPAQGQPRPPSPPKRPEQPRPFPPPRRPEPYAQAQPGWFSFPEQPEKPAQGQPRPPSPPKRQEQPADDNDSSSSSSSPRPKKRGKRVPGTRLHRKLDSHAEGKAFLDEMTTFFEENFETTSNMKEYINASDLLVMFRSKRQSTTDLEAGLFHRHCRRILVTVWPNIKYTNCAGKRVYRFLKAK